MEALFTSTAVVALAEIGDKTQLLAIVLATRFKKPLATVQLVPRFMLQRLQGHGFAIKLLIVGR